MNVFTKMWLRRSFSKKDFPVIVTDESSDDRAAGNIDKSEEFRCRVSKVTVKDPSQ